MLNQLINMLSECTCGHALHLHEMDFVSTGGVRPGECNFCPCRSFKQR